MLVRDTMGTNEGKQLKYFQLMEDLKAKILTGEIQAGDKLPSENELSAQYKISRQTVRKALSMLQNAGYIYAKVEVMIEDGRIVSINLMEHRNERGKTAEVIVDNVVATQKIDVDAVSGATNSSNVIKKAIENAVTQ